MLQFFNELVLSSVLFATFPGVIEFFFTVPIEIYLKIICVITKCLIIRYLKGEIGNAAVSNTTRLKTYNKQILTPVK